jgi:SNF2 family DNA or RNA helicase
MHSEDFLFDHDVVLTNYEALRLCGSMYSRIKWHRIVLDECQEIKVATNAIASRCADLVANHRWMVSGTPLCSKIEDLHGELNFLQVWPFCLSNQKDGFWEVKIGRPFRERDETALTLLHALIDVVMMRHR